MSTHIWRVVKLEAETDDFTQFTAHYTVAINDGTFAVGTYGDVKVTRPETTPFVSMTQEQVIYLTKEALGPEKVAEIEGVLDARMISGQQPPTTRVLPNPWEYSGGEVDSLKGGNN